MIRVGDPVRYHGAALQSSSQNLFLRSAGCAKVNALWVGILNGMPSAQKPLVGITMGDPAGIGPEIIAKAWTRPEVHAWCRPLAVGDARIFRRALLQRGAHAHVDHDLLHPWHFMDVLVLPLLGQSRSHFVHEFLIQSSFHSALAHGLCRALSNSSS